MQSVSQSVSQCVIEDRWKRRRKKKAEAHVRSVSDYSPFLPSPLLRSSLRPSLAVVASRASCPICGAAAAAVVYSLHFLLFLIVPSCTDDGCDASANRTDKPERLKPLRDGRTGGNICVPTRGAPTKTNAKTRRIEEKVEEGEEQSAAAAIKRGKGRSRRREEKYVKVPTDLGRTAVSSNGRMQSPECRFSK